MKIRMILMALAALLCLASCSDDDSGIQLRLLLTLLQPIPIVAAR